MQSLLTCYGAIGKVVIVVMGLVVSFLLYDTRDVNDANLARGRIQR